MISFIQSSFNDNANNKQKLLHPSWNKQNTNDTYLVMMALVWYE